MNEQRFNEYLAARFVEGTVFTPLASAHDAS